MDGIGIMELEIIGRRGTTTKPSIKLLLLAVLCLALLAGCGCQHEWTEASCAAPKTCALCGATEGSPLSHQWSSGNCEDPRTCEICGESAEEALGHSWMAATCESPRTCEICGSTVGSPRGHAWTMVSEALLHCGICGGEMEPKYVAITFDDGPSGQYTETLLAGLAERNVHSTFFLCGYRLVNARELAGRIADAGHEIALHGYSHTMMSQLSGYEIRKELEDTLALVPEGSNVTLMRPPGGDITDSVRSVTRELGLSIIMWSVDPEDWDTDSAQEIEQKILEQVQEGDIILLHDMSNSSVEAALNVIDELSGQGYVFVTVSELARLQGQSLIPGETYKSIQGE